MTSESFIWEPVTSSHGQLINSSHRKIVWRVDRRVWQHCDELTVLFDLAVVTLKSFAVISDFDTAHIKPK